MAELKLNISPNEELLYFVWKFSFYKHYRLFDTDFKVIDVENPGMQNFDSGPDFTEAKIKTGNTIWVGNVEIHVKSSDWYRHGHHLDKAYNNVILQVVLKHDEQVVCENGRILPVLEIEMSDKIIEKYNGFLSEKSFIPCAKDVKLVDIGKIHFWLGNVLAERISEKSMLVGKILEKSKNSWEDTFYQLLARSFGFKVNADPFEWLAESLPLRILAKHRASIMQIEALLFGQAGFLNDTILNCDYYNSLQREYRFLKAKYKLNPIEKHLWKFMRTRPSNFPTIRISQFANLVYKSNSLFSKILETNSVESIKALFDVESSEFWDSHYLFEKETIIKKKVIGDKSIETIFINTIIPLLFIYGNSNGDELQKDKAISFLEKLKPEKNAIMDNWKKLGLKISSAFESQALLQQKKKYCSDFRCLECGIGLEILRQQFKNAT